MASLNLPTERAAAAVIHEPQSKSWKYAIAAIHEPQCTRGNVHSVVYCGACVADAAMHKMARGLRQCRKRQWYAAIRALLDGPQFEVSQFSYNSKRNFQALSGRAFKRLHTVLCNVTNLGWMNHTSAYFSSKKDNSWTKIWREEPSPVPVLNMHQNQNLVKTQIQKFWLLHAPEILYAPAAMSWLFFKLLAFFRNCFLCWDCWNGDEMPTLDQGKAWLSITTRRLSRLPLHLTCR